MLKIVIEWRVEPCGSPFQKFSGNDWDLVLVFMISQVVEFSPRLRRLGAIPFPRPHGVAWRAGKEPGRIWHRRVNGVNLDWRLVGPSPTWVPAGLGTANLQNIYIYLFIYLETQTQMGMIIQAEQFEKRHDCRQVLGVVCPYHTKWPVMAAAPAPKTIKNAPKKWAKINTSN